MNLGCYKKRKALHLLLTMKNFKDQMGRTIVRKEIPKRIVSLVPSQTELLFDLGLKEEVVGITKFCIHPAEMFRTKTKVGGTKNADIEKIISLAPDLIIGNKEENKKEQIEELMKHFPVWMSDVKTMDDALAMIEMIGELVGKKEKAIALKNKIQDQFKNFKPDIRNKKIAYLIWKKPYMTVNKDTFINHMLELCGLKNIFANHTDRYPEINAEELKEANPELIFLSSEPYPFKEKHIAEFKTICPDAFVQIVDGELFSWYGSRLLQTPEYLKSLIKNIL